MTGITRKHIEIWRESVIWVPEIQVEHDLVLSRAVVELFNNPLLSDRIAMLGGTALYKFHMDEEVRFSEDVDLGLTKSVSVNETLREITKILSPWLKPQRPRGKKRKSINCTYKSLTPNNPVVKLKLDLDTEEIGSILEYESGIPFSVDIPGWFEGEAKIRTFKMEEIMSKKLRALMQRDKGRDLFDLWNVLEHGSSFDIDAMLRCFQHYMTNRNLNFLRSDCERKLNKKLKNPYFRDDTTLLVNENDFPSWDIDKAGEIVCDKILSKLE